VAKILVADDNSNVQKTVALALADLGVDVISVNNGDAAVRKLADISPDLVLADIFMPVRNGYEVCEYVKKDSRFAQVPVVLLVGAFDPLDEREAQRVGADGILKKPFDPPDPLITMVKALLDRSLSERLVTASVSKSAISMQGRASSGGAAATEMHSTATETSGEPPKDELQASLSRLSFGEGERPIAFGQLLDAPTQESGSSGTGVIEPVDDEQILTSSRDASLGDPIFWQPEGPEPATEEGAENPEEELANGISVHEWEQSEDSSPHRRGPGLLQEPIEPLELVREDQDQESDGTPTNVEASASITQDPASQASLTVETAKPASLAANPIEWMASAPSTELQEPAEEAAAPEWGDPTPEATDTVESIEAKGPETAPGASEPVQMTPPVAAPVVTPVSVTTPAPPESKTTTQEPEPAKTQPSYKPFSQSADDTARSIPRQDWASLAASLRSKPSSSAMDKAKPLAPPAAAVPQTPVQATPNAQQAAPNSASAVPAPPDPALVEAVVQRVLDKMRPQVVDIITKEFLRPVVQALVHREIEKR